MGLWLGLGMLQVGVPYSIKRHAYSIHNFISTQSTSMREIIAGTEGWGGGRGRRRRHQARLLLLIIMVLQPQPELPNQSTHTKPYQTTTKDDRSRRPASSMILIFMLRQSPFPPVPVQFDFILPPPLLCRSAAQSLDHPLSRFITFVLSRL